ncbi:MAG: glycoside hydrolase family 2, partial [Sphingobacteriales bacterium]
LNIDIGMFNGPGGSQSGGPWIKPEQSMRYLTSSEVSVKGPMVFNKKLPQPNAVFQDVKVVAYPVSSDYYTDINKLKPTLSSVPVIDSLNNLIDQNKATAIHFGKNQQLSVDIKTQASYTARSVTIFTTNQNVRIEGDIQAKVNNEYVTLRHFNIDRTNGNTNVGFVPFGPAAISVPATTSNNFRLVFTNITGNSGISEVKLSATPMVENYIEKTLAKMWPTPHPFWDAYQWPIQPDAASANVIDPAKVIDISKYMAADGTLNWKVPAGNWIIERSGMTPTNVTNSPATKEGTGLEVDKMSAKHIASHFEAFMGQVIKRIPAEDRKSFKVVVADSYETGAQNWTDELINEFKQAYKYDPI